MGKHIKKMLWFSLQNHSQTIYGESCTRGGKDFLFRDVHVHTWSYIRISDGCKNGVLNSQKRRTYPADYFHIRFWFIWRLKMSCADLYKKSKGKFSMSSKFQHENFICVQRWTFSTHPEEKFLELWKVFKDKGNCAKHLPENREASWISSETICFCNVEG